MLDAGGGAVRLLRALGFVAAIVSLTSAGHITGGGEASLVGVAALVLLAWPAALLASRRQRQVRHLLPTLAIGQSVGHGVLGFFSAGDAVVACTTSGVHHVVHLACLPHPAGHGGMAPMGLLMGGAHLVAALVLAIALARGEAVLWRLVDLVLPTLPRVARRVTTRVRVSADVALRRSQPLVGLAPGRGPPVSA